ncbi:possible soluble lytic murein transglycosylase [Oceanicola granulosus HTCC2516]|uniref:Possible soluble lytic murein transglycosylase n=1 Tax=Oceanicola granulosus (strain ATCC BAA-861 / DSM 15982 / KCTC 12143 / HTCC2516) TaxID=314256 RepID=Q2CIE9_OCEGH|nr:lytic transglycosylase domain-containing protein [Oceanicola granulosus]EAR52309.1 possible soluble lytic murein transglycosylase [Oceanicola granulosus HTCC2516]
MTRRGLSAILLALTALTCAGEASADGNRLQADFTFRRVGVPAPGQAGRRINVQIAPRAPAAPSAPAVAGSAVIATGSARVGAAAVAPAPASPPEIDWFWSEISPAAADSGPGRLAPALRALDTAPGGLEVRSPALQGLSDLARLHGRAILRETVGTRVSPALVLAVISVESGGRTTAISSAGAGGLMQLMPATAARFGVVDRLDATDNIKGGVAYLDWLMGHFDNDPILVLAAYNAGEGAVRSHAGVPPYGETRNYVPKVLAAWRIARGLCVTPPELISDGCVFAVES